MNPTTDAAPAKPRFALAIATALGLGYLPKAPGTWGSAGGVALAVLMNWVFSRRLLQIAALERNVNFWTIGLAPGYGEYALVLFVSLVGVYAAGQTARYAASKDPQFVVIDEVSGQLLTYINPLVLFNWKSLLLGFILFRVFDIWKPFPARQAESLPGGLGIMADDWIAGAYAALVLGLARHFGF
jgi:phosphatidylglycerophosphatase A